MIAIMFLPCLKENTGPYFSVSLAYWIGALHHMKTTTLNVFTKEIYGFTVGQGKTTRLQAQEGEATLYTPCRGGRVLPTF